MPACNISNGFPGVSVWIIPIPTYAIFGTYRRLFWSYHNSRDDALELFRNFSAIWSMIRIHITQQRGRVVELGRRAARTRLRDSEAVWSGSARMTTSEWIQIREWLLIARGGSGIGSERRVAAITTQLREMLSAELSGCDKVMVRGSTAKTRKEPFGTKQVYVASRPTWSQCKRNLTAKLYRSGGEDEQQIVVRTELERL